MAPLDVAGLCDFTKMVPVVAVCLLAGCSSVGYLAQAARGQWQLVVARQPIERLLADPNLDPVLAEHLRLIEAARDFAAAELALPVGRRYTSYVATGRTHVVWNVFAAPRLSVDPLTWCFPIAGCVPYRGYFAEPAALRFAARLEARGFDTYVAGVDAYSTLGWFDDPVLDTFIRREPPDLLALVFHELAHARVYVPGDTTFNESYASTVEIAGVEAWYRRHPDPRALQGFRARRAVRARFSAFVIEWRERLRAIYAEVDGNLAPGDIRGPAFAAMRRDYQSRRSELGGGAYDGFFDGLNNARLVPFHAYAARVPAFERLLREAGSMAAFHRRVEGLARLPQVERERRLDELVVSRASSSTPR